jgi:class 3 adenylate cyclase/tetratricopeptide (TPR) repeat protein
MSGTVMSSVSTAVTVLFTDLVGSTEMSTHLEPADADEVRRIHFGLLRGAIAVAGGTEVKALGDGLMATFASVRGGLRAAVGIQQAIERHNRRTAFPLAVRIGLAHGEATVDEGDYYGDHVVVAARLCAMAQGGQILTTELVRAVAGRLAGQPFMSLGSFELKGIPEPIPVSEVRWHPTPDEEARYPLPLRLASDRRQYEFVGRAAERAILSSTFEEGAAEIHTKLVMVSGEPGIGKTRLVTEFARERHDNGAIVLYGHCDEDVGTAYQPWAEALAHLVEHASAEFVSGLAGRVPDLGRLGAPIARQLGGLWHGGSTDLEAARYELFEAVATALRAASELAPVVLLLDDLQWADLPSLQLLRHTVSSIRLSPMTIVGTFRDSRAQAAHPIHDLFATLHRETVVDRITLDGLTDDECLALMESMAGHPLGQAGVALRDAVVQETDGNPFFVGELLRHLAETGAISRDESGQWTGSESFRDHGLPVSVREVIGRRVAGLGDQAMQALMMAAVSGRRFELEVVAMALDTKLDVLLDVMDAAVAATLVTNDSGQNYRFVHALIEHGLYDRLTPGRRVWAHRRIAEAMERVHEHDLDVHVGELAYQWRRATTPGNAWKAIDYARRTGERALHQLAPDEAVHWYEQALELFDQEPAVNDSLRAGLLVGLGTAQRQIGDSSHRQTLLDAAALAQRSGTNDALVSAALNNTRGFFSSAGTIDDERVAVLESAVSVTGKDSPDRARLLALLAVELTFGEDLPRRSALADEALAIARRTNDAALLASVITTTYHALNEPESLARRLSDTREALDAAREAREPLLEYRAADYLAHSAIEACDVEEGDRAMATVLTISERLDQPTLRWNTCFLASCRAYVAGRLDEAERLATEAFQAGTDTGQPDAGAIFGAQIGYVRLAQGRADEIVQLVERRAAESRGVPAWRAFLAWVYSDLGRHEEARSVLSSDIDDEFTSFRHDQLWISAMAINALVVARLQDRRSADAIFEQLIPFEDQFVYNGVTTMGAVAQALGRLAATMERWPDAAAFFEKAQTTHERMGARYFLAETQFEHGRLLAQSSAKTGTSRARALLENALATAREQGYGRMARSASVALRELGRP